jgi:hypothetical protein
MTFASVAALGWPLASSAQLYRPEPVVADGPAANLALSRDAVDALNAQFEEDVRALGAFAGGKRGVDRFPREGELKPDGWKFYGRVYLFNFKKEEEGDGQISWRKLGPKIGGARIYIGVHKELD